jgi:hypothetical protein
MNPRTRANGCGIAVAVIVALMMWGLHAMFMASKLHR